jgi:hypothetical protein
MSPNPSGAPLPLDDLRGATTLRLERTVIRTRESGTVTSAWRLAVRAPAGEGTISALENPEGGMLYRGEGIFLGWRQAQLEIAYARLRPPAPSPEPDPGQFG